MVDTYDKAQATTNSGDYYSQPYGAVLHSS